eukprot:gene5792-11082_t
MDESLSDTDWSHEKKNNGIYHQTTTTMRLETVIIEIQSDYVEDIKTVIFNTNLKALKKIPNSYTELQPPQLNASFEKVPRSEAIAKYLERKGTVTELYPDILEQEQQEENQANDDDAEASVQKKVRSCQKCRKPMKGHKVGKLDV